MDKKSFEASLEALEKIVDALESGDLPLEDAVKKYEEGMKLSAHCQTLLENAENVLTKVMNDKGKEADFELDE